MRRHGKLFESWTREYLGNHKETYTHWADALNYSIRYKPYSEGFIMETKFYVLVGNSVHSGHLDLEGAQQRAESLVDSRNDVQIVKRYQKVKRVKVVFEDIK